MLVLDGVKDEWLKYPKFTVNTVDVDEAGLAYTGLVDRARCQHMLTGGQTNFEKVNHWGYPEELYSSGKMYGSGSEINLLESVAAQSCLEMDFPEEKVKQAIDIYRQRNGDHHFKAKDLCEILFEIEEKEDQICADVTDGVTPPVVVAVTGLEENDIPVFFENLTGCRMCSYNLEHISLLAYHHLTSCSQCAPLLSIPKTTVCSRDRVTSK